MKNRREKIREILDTEFSTLKESIGFEAFSDLLDKVTATVMDLSKPKAEIVHIIGPNGSHRLQVDGKSTEWKAPHEIARYGDFVAATDHYIGQLPQVGRLMEVDREHYRTESQQSMSLETVRFSTAT